MKVIMILCAIITALLIIFLYTWYRFRKTIYVHTTPNHELFNKYPIEHKNVKLTTKDNIHLSAWYIPVPKPKAVVILIHGFTDVNGGKELMLPHADYLKKEGYSTLLVDLRSVGNSEGNKIFLGIKEWQDIESAYDYLHSLPENKDIKIGLFGISMGGSTAIIASGLTGKGDFVIASVPYSSYDQEFSFKVKKEHLPEFILVPFMKLCATIEFGNNYKSYDPIKLIKNIHVPILIMGAKDDKNVGYSQSEDLFKAANKPKYFWSANAHHDIHLEKPTEFKNKIISFLSSLN